MDPQMIDPITNALLHKNWSAITGFVIVFLVNMAKRMGLTSKLNAKLLPLVSVGLGVVLAVGDNLISRPTATGIYETVIKGVLAGLTATGFWELVFKHYAAGVTAAPVVVATNPPTVEVPAAPVVAVPVASAPVAPVAVVAPVVEVPVSEAPLVVVPSAIEPEAQKPGV